MYQCCVLSCRQRSLSVCVCECECLCVYKLYTSIRVELGPTQTTTTAATPADDFVKFERRQRRRRTEWPLLSLAPPLHPSLLRTALAIMYFKFKFN